MGQTTDLRVVFEAFKCVLAILTAVVFQSHDRRLSRRVGLWHLVGPLVDAAQSHSEVGLGATPSRSPVAPFQTGVAQNTQVPAHDPADVGSQRQVDDGIIDGGGLGKHGWHGESQRGNVINMSKGGPHGHHSVGTPGRKETDAHGNASLADEREAGQEKVRRSH